MMSAASIIVDVIDRVSLESLDLIEAYLRFAAMGTGLALGLAIYAVARIGEPL